MLYVNGTDKALSLPQDDVIKEAPKVKLKQLYVLMLNMLLKDKHMILKNDLRDKSCKIAWK